MPCLLQARAVVEKNDSLGPDSPRLSKSCNGRPKRNGASARSDGFCSYCRHPRFVAFILVECGGRLSRRSVLEDVFSVDKNTMVSGLILDGILPFAYPLVDRPPDAARFPCRNLFSCVVRLFVSANFATIPCFRMYIVLVPSVACRTAPARLPCGWPARLPERGRSGLVYHFHIDLACAPGAPGTRSISLPIFYQHIIRSSCE